MRIAVLGPGALGCLLAGRLGEAGEDVILLDRDRERASRIRRDGVRIDLGGETLRVTVPVAADPAEAGAADLLIVAVKAYDTEAAVRQWRGVVRDAAPGEGRRPAGGGTFLTLQNGQGNIEAIIAALGEEAALSARVVGGVTAEGATLLGPGHVRHAGSGETVLAGQGAVADAIGDRAPGAGQDANRALLRTAGRAAAEIAAAPLRRAGFDVRVEDDLQEVIWSKFIVNVGVNGLAGVLDLTNGELLEHDGARTVIRALVGEAAAVAAPLGGRIDPDTAARRAEDVLRRTGENVNSLLQDLRRGRRTEIDQLNGCIVNVGRSLGIETPVNRTVWAMVRALETSGVRATGGGADGPGPKREDG